MGGTHGGEGAIAADEIVQVRAVDVFENEKMELIFVVEIERAYDVRMIEPGDGAGFAVEAFERSGIFRERERQHLEGDPASHRQVFAQVNRPHAARAEPFEQAIFFGDNKSAPAATQQLLGLEPRQLTALDKSPGELRNGRARFFGCADGAHFQQSAADAEFEEFVNGYWRGHRVNHGNAVAGGGAKAQAFRVICEGGTRQPQVILA